MATHSSIFAWRIPWTEHSGRLQSVGSKESDTAEQLNITQGAAPEFEAPESQNTVLSFATHSVQQ